MISWFTGQRSTIEPRRTSTFEKNINNPSAQPLWPLKPLKGTQWPWLCLPTGMTLQQSQSPRPAAQGPSIPVLLQPRLNSPKIGPSHLSLLPSKFRFLNLSCIKADKLGKGYSKCCICYKTLYLLFWRGSFHLFYHLKILWLKEQTDLIIISWSFWHTHFIKATHLLSLHKCDLFQNLLFIFYI